ncbi:hypothetical protein IID22_03145 [Patescibacteria group bacterium]|nr:hypothetical protein [Patescibacteria group bacterium]
MSPNDEGYTNDALNKINSLFYSSVDEAFENTGLADFFIKIEPIQIAIAKKIEELIPKTTIRIKELGSGKDLTRWEIISKQKSKRKWDVILSDFSANTLPDLKRIKKSENFRFSTEKLDLLRPFKRLTEKEKVDVILTTYTFDSIWFAEDFHYEKLKNKWYVTKYKVEVDEKNTKKLSDFKKIRIKKRLSKIKIEDEKYGDVISKYYSHKSKVSINFPGGLIDKIKEAFEKQITKTGIFIIGDMAVDNRQGRISEDSPNGDPLFMKDYATSGKVAKFKVEDYGLAKIILESEGFNVELESVEDFIKNSGYEIPLEVKDHFLMVIKADY